MQEKIKINLSDTQRKLSLASIELEELKEELARINKEAYKESQSFRTQCNKLNKIVKNTTLVLSTSSIRCMLSKENGL